MKKLLIKLIIFTMILFTFTGCYTLSKTYFYNGVLYQNTKKHDFEKYFYIHGSSLNRNTENSLISYISLSWNYQYQYTEKVEIISKKVKIIYKGREYTVEVADDKKGISVYKNGIKIGDGAIIKIGKVKINDKIIIEMPPIKMKSYLRVTKFSPVLDGLKIDDSSEKIYYGPVEGYKGG